MTNVFQCPKCNKKWVDNRLKIVCIGKDMNENNWYYVSNDEVPLQTCPNCMENKYLTSFPKDFVYRREIKDIHKHRRVMF